MVPWARPNARHTRDFQDGVAWLAQRADKTTITKLLRCSWEAVARIVVAVVEEEIDDSRLDDLYRIGVDEVRNLQAWGDSRLLDTIREAPVPSCSAQASVLEH